MRVIVIGGGITGLACSYRLAEAGVDVTVLEKNALGTGSTGRANGGIRAQFSTPTNVRLSLESLDVWTDFEERFGVDIDFRQNGYLLLASEPESAAAFRRNVRMQRAQGVPSTYLTGSEIARHSPHLRTEDLEAATYSPTDGFADPNLAVQGFAEAAADAGVDLATGTPAVDIESLGSGYRVSTPDGRLDADAVVNAAGPWTGEIAEMVGIDLPVRLIRRQLALLEPEIRLDDDHPYTYHVDRTVSYRPERGPDALVSGNFEGAARELDDPDRFDPDVETSFAVGALERLDELTEYFGPESKFKGGWAGVYTVTPDHNPIIDEIRPGFVVAAGFSGHGFMHAPAVGRVVSELLVDDRVRLVDPSPYRFDRFEDDDEREETITP